jgi:hypothetical protein
MLIATPAAHLFVPLPTAWVTENDPLKRTVAKASSYPKNEGG